MARARAIESRPVLLERVRETLHAAASDDGVRAVYAAHGGELYRFAVRSLGDSGLAEEAALVLAKLE